MASATPLELNTLSPIGGFLAHFFRKRSEKLGEIRGRSLRERGAYLWRRPYRSVREAVN